jgi:hypothetical protein
MTTNGSFDALVQWYAAHCNGAWEHTYGIKLDTLDNPGWSLTVDLAETELEHAPFSVAEHQLENDVSWWRCWRDDTAFHAACGVNNLSAVLVIFTTWVKSCRSSG